MTAIQRGTSASEIFNLGNQTQDQYRLDDYLIFGNGGNDRYIIDIDDSDNDPFYSISVISGSGNDYMEVTNDFGSSFQEPVSFAAGGGADTLKVNSGIVDYDGDAGTDTLILNGALNEYSVFSAGAAAEISSPFDEGSDQDESFVSIGALDVEIFQFSNITVTQNDGYALVDDLFYLANNPDVAAAGIDPEVHYANFGRFENRDPNAYFDTSEYLTNNPDVAAAGVDPLEHYRIFGWKEGRDPSENFDTSAYLAANPDVAAAGVNPLEHYLLFGVVEGRATFSTTGEVA